MEHGGLRMKQNKKTYEIICPCFWIDQDHFEDNLKSWIQEIKPTKILLGVNKQNILSYLEEIQKKYPVIELIDQLHLSTLGGCLADLIKKVQTEWYVYVHTDVRITPYAFLIMQQYQKEDVGIIESHREHWDGKVRYIRGEDLPAHIASDYYFRDRSFSGLQLIQLKAIRDLVERLEDDFLYRNEDMIFHAECVKNGYRYCKTWAMHIHQTNNKKWSIDDQTTHRMQYKGFIKYTELSDLTEYACLSAIKYIKTKYKEPLDVIIYFCYSHSNEWAEKIAKVWDSLK